MARTQAKPTKPAPRQRGVLARPLEALAFLLPLMAVYQVAVWWALRHGGAWAEQGGVVSFNLLRRFFELFGQFGIWAPAVAVVVILLATQLFSGEKWRIKPGRVGLMYGEAIVLALPLFGLRAGIGLAAGPAAGEEWWASLALGIGAGIYEELVFRLILITLLVIVGYDLLRQPLSTVAIVAVALSSLAFAAHHHQPIGAEPFSLLPFLFRTLAGGYLAVIFWYRGYGPAAGCHAAYNVAVVALARWG